VHVATFFAVFVTTRSDMVLV